MILAVWVVIATAMPLNSAPVSKQLPGEPFSLQADCDKYITGIRGAISKDPRAGLIKYQCKEQPEY